MFYFCDTKGTTGNELVLGSRIANDRSTLLWFINTATNSNKCVGAEYNQGASDAQVRQAIAFAINNKYNVTTRNSLSYEKIQKYISTSKLMGIKMVWNSGGAHALVLSGYSADGKVTLVDPAANAGIERYSYSSLVAGTTIQSGSGRYTKTWTLD